jgi:hypothetical protein
MTSTAIPRKEVWVMRKDIADHLPVLQAAFVEFAQDTLLPELCTVFKGDDVARFLELFAGLTFKVPSRTLVESILTTVDIYMDIEKHPYAIETIAERNGMTKHYASALHSRIKSRMEALCLTNPPPKKRKRRSSRKTS